MILDDTQGPQMIQNMANLMNFTFSSVNEGQMKRLVSFIIITRSSAVCQQTPIVTLWLRMCLPTLEMFDHVGIGAALHWHDCHSRRHLPCATPQPISRPSIRLRGWPPLSCLLSSSSSTAASSTSSCCSSSRHCLSLLQGRTSPAIPWTELQGEKDDPASSLTRSTGS